jgi:indolepyruvate ferredoxin oxidoreductase
LSVALFGDDQFANMMLLGAGYQAGGLPLPAMAIEEAITLNGVAAATNIQAFRRGRQFVFDQTSLRAAAGVTQPAAGDQVTETVDALVARRSQELTRYDNAAYARRYTQEIARIADHEAAVRPGSTELTRIAAQNLFKLMAYKDEYEVARLHLDPTVRAGVTESFGPSARVSYNLLPPSLRALGLRKKVRFGPWFRVPFRVLYAARRLRGTRLDPFGRAEVRRVERALVREYVDILHECGERLDEASFDAIATLLGLPDMVRGFEEVKLRNVDRYRREVAVQLTNLRDLENHGSLGALTGRTGDQCEGH